jgi:hypothetical protein
MANTDDSSTGGIRAALEYAVSLATTASHVVRDDEREITYFDKPVFRAPKPEKPELASALGLTTLRSLADYVRHNVDGLDMTQHLLHVVSPTRVDLVSKLEDYHRRREVVVSAAYPSPTEKFLEMTREREAWVPLEDAVINLMALFAPQGHRDLLLSVLRSISTEDIQLREDDSMSQKVTVMQGVHVKGVGTVPNPAMLAPFRTFPEVAKQPESLFIVRLREGQRGPEVLLKPADGGAWALEAVEGIGTVLIGYLADLDADKAPQVIF